MKQYIYVLVNDNIVLEKSYSSLKDACDKIGISYWTVSKSFNGLYSRNGKQIVRTELNKIKGRGRK